jgi:hypothetical protein
MKYFIRSVKYFFYFAFILSLIMAALAFIGLVDADIETMFRDGTKSILQIALLFVVVAAVYPKFGFSKRFLQIGGEFSEVRDGIVKQMEARGYRLESEKGENMTFRLRSKVNAIARMMEDRITMTREIGGWSVEGLTKDVIRVIGGLEYNFRKEEEQ